MKSKKNEGTHYNTKIRSLDEKAGLRRIRMGLRESYRLIGNILDPNHPTPNPESDKDAKVLNECMASISESANKLLNVKTVKRMKKA